MVYLGVQNYTALLKLNNAASYFVVMQAIVKLLDSRRSHCIRPNISILLSKHLFVKT